MADLISTLRNAGFKGDSLRTAWAVAMAESGGRPDAYNPNRSTGDDSYGVFQINMLGGLGPARRKQYGLRSNEDLYDAATNARVAYAMSKGGTDWGPWSAFKTGAYKQYLAKYPGAPNAAAAAQGTPSSPAAQPRTPASRRKPAPVAVVTRAAPVTMKQLDGLARQFGFGSFAKAFGQDDTGEISALLKQALASRQVPKAGPPGAQVPVVSTAGRQSNPLVARVVEMADDYLGVKYRWGGKTPEGFDCSGFVQYLYGKVGVKLPGYTIPLYATGKKVDKRSELQPGDAVFFNWGRHPQTGEEGPQHMGLYIGNGLFVQAPRTGDVVKISRMSDRRDFLGGRRYL